MTSADMTPLATSRSPLEVDATEDVAYFDLNDIHSEPSDEQLQSIMRAVAEEAQRKSSEVKKKLLDDLRENLRKQKER